jgi:uncharacterized membrane protein
MSPAAGTPVQPQGRSGVGIVPATGVSASPPTATTGARGGTNRPVPPVPSRTGAPPSTPPPGMRARLEDWRHWIGPWTVLSLMMAAFFAVTFDVAWTSYANVTPGGIGGATDLSIMIQALTATSHGYIPFYESPDCVHTARCSLFLVHPAIALYLLVPVYSLDPTPALLFGLQSAAMALAAIPLYLLTTGLSGSRWKGVLVGGVYLIFLPAISSIDFSFHVEPFLPLELFTLFWLWAGRRYWVGTAVAVLAVLTFDINSVLIFFFGVFFLWPFLASAGNELLDHVRESSTARQFGATLRRQLRALVRSPGARPARAALGLMALAVAGYLFLRFFVDHSTLFGLPALPARFALPVNQPNPQVHFALIFGGSLTNWLIYWIFAFGLLGFVGFLAPRTLWVALPWVAYTAVSVSPNYTTLGLHYGAITSVPLLLGFAYGVAKLPLGRAPAGLPRKQRRTFQAKRAAAYAIVAVVIGLNLALTPLSPLATPLAASEIPVYAHYPSSLAQQPGVLELQELGRMVPQYSTLLAPYLLLPFVARDIYAYPYPPGSTGNLPFTVGALPSYVLTDPTDVSSLPANVQKAIYNPNDYGALAVVPVTPIGMVTLFERGWTGSTTVLGPTPNPSTSFTPSALRVSGNATGLVHAAGSPYGIAVQSKTASVAGDLLFASPGASLPPGKYTVAVSLWVAAPGGTSGLNSKFLRLNATAISGPPLYSTALAYASYPGGSWFNVTESLTLSAPIYGFQFEGALVVSHNGYEVECGGLSLTA